MDTCFSHIAVCVDNSDPSTDALGEAWRLAQAVGSPRFSVVHVIAAPMVVAGHGAMWLPDPSEMAEGVNAWMSECASRYPGAEVVVLDGYPPAAACEWARDADVDLLVAASNRGLFERVLLGSFAGYLARHAPCPVLLTRPRVAANERTEPTAAEVAS